MDGVFQITIYEHRGSTFRFNKLEARTRCGYLHTYIENNCEAEGGTKLVRMSYLGGTAVRLKTFYLGVLHRLCALPV